MKQDIYDDKGFFLQYSKMRRSTGGLDSAEEWPAFRALLPDLMDKYVLDLGCGFGWHCRYARQQKARSVIGVDLSEQMLAQAKALTNDLGVATLERRSSCGDECVADLFRCGRASSDQSRRSNRWL